MCLMFGVFWFSGVFEGKKPNQAGLNIFYIYKK